METEPVYPWLFNVLFAALVGAAIAVFLIRVKGTWAIAKLTFWEGIRQRIVLVFIIVLIFLVLFLPFTLRGDETLAGRLKTFLAYSLGASSLGAVSIFMSLATIFFSCSTLTRDIADRSIHLVITKPVSRFQILVGKWLGVNLLNVLILGLCGLAIYGFAAFIKNQPEQFKRDRYNLDDVIWTARVAARPAEDDFEALARENVEERIASGTLETDRKAFAITQRALELAEESKRISPESSQLYRFKGLAPPDRADTVYQVRFKARSIPLTPSETLAVIWVIRDPESARQLAAFPTNERSGIRHQFLVTANVIKDGSALLEVRNPSINGNRVIYFEGDDGLELLYKAGSFESNYAKALLMILCRLAFLSAVALFFSTFVSFPVACFCVLSIFLFCLGVPWWLEAIGANMGTYDVKLDPFGSFGPYIRIILVPVLKVLLPNFVEYDGVSKLIEGYYIDNAQVMWAVLHTLLYGVALLALPGWLIFRSREVAETIV